MAIAWNLNHTSNAVPPQVVAGVVVVVAPADFSRVVVNIAPGAPGVKMYDPLHSSFSMPFSTHVVNAVVTGNVPPLL